MVCGNGEVNMHYVAMYLLGRLITQHQTIAIALMSLTWLEARILNPPSIEVIEVICASLLGYLHNL